MSTQDTSVKSGLFLLGISLSLGLIVASIILSITLSNIKMSDKTITVKGYAEKNITSDLAIWSGTISVRSSDMTVAYDKLQKDMSKFISYLKSKGIETSKITTSSISTIKNFRYTPEGYSTGQIDSYELTQTVSITSENVNLVNQISGEATSLIKDGLEIYSNPPQFYYTKLNDLKIEMLGDAAKDAKLRAEKLAKSSGGDVGPMKSATQGVFQITPLYSTTVSDWGEYDLTSIQKTIKSVVTIDFTIK